MQVTVLYRESGSGCDDSPVRSEASGNVPPAGAGYNAFQFTLVSLHCRWYNSRWYMVPADPVLRSSVHEKRCCCPSASGVATAAAIAPCRSRELYAHLRTAKGRYAPARVRKACYFLGSACILRSTTTYISVRTTPIVVLVLHCTQQQHRYPFGI